jgi:hypothetical protein
MIEVRNKCVFSLPFLLSLLLRRKFLLRCRNLSKALALLDPHAASLTSTPPDVAPIGAPAMRGEAMKWLEEGKKEKREKWARRVAEDLEDSDEEEEEEEEGSGSGEEEEEEEEE